MEARSIAFWFVSAGLGSRKKVRQDGNLLETPTRKGNETIQRKQPDLARSVCEAGDLLFHLARRLSDRAAGLVDRHPGRLDMDETSRAFRRSRAAHPRRAFIADDSRSIAGADR